MPEAPKKKKAPTGAAGIPKHIKWRVFQLAKWNMKELEFQDDKTYIQRFVNCQVLMTVDQIMHVKNDLIMICYNNKWSDQKGYAEVIKIYKHSQKREWKYALVDIYSDWDLPYHYERKRALINLHKVLPNIHMGIHYTHSSPQSAMQLRAMLKNHTMKYPALEFVQDNMLAVDKYNFETIQGQQLNIIRFLGSMYLKPLFADESEKWQKVVRKYKSPFLLKRGFSKRRLFKDSYDGDTTSRWRHYAKDDPEKLASESAFWNHDGIFTREDHPLENRYQFHLDELTKACPTRLGLLEIIDITILKGQLWDEKDINWFEYICCGAFFPELKFEMQHLDSRKGNTKEDFHLVLFFFLLRFGYVDVFVGRSMDMIAALLATPLWNWLTGKKTFNFTDTNTYYLPCCDREHHKIKIHRFDNQFRRATLDVKDSDGECCYRWMWNKTFPEAKLKAPMKKKKQAV
mmetsp:Transcript_6907/g.9023  ORF Transcript_6907/g.9023 Transcript_6907/m.9023 type:complete len:458 (-) Transcript_6907:673-2046(-)